MILTPKLLQKSCINVIVCTDCIFKVFLNELLDLEKRTRVYFLRLDCLCETSLGAKKYCHSLVFFRAKQYSVSCDLENWDSRK